MSLAFAVLALFYTMVHFLAKWKTKFRKPTCPGSGVSMWNIQLKVQGSDFHPWLCLESLRGTLKKILLMSGLYLKLIKSEILGVEPGLTFLKLPY